MTLNVLVLLLAAAAGLAGLREPGPGAQRAGETQALRPGDRAELTVRWLIEDGYYLDEKTTSSLVFTPPAGISLTPAKLETSGRVIGVSEQTASVSVSSDVPPGVHRVKVEAVIYFCSLREQWCKRVTRTVQLPIEVSAEAGSGQKALELELRVPLDDER